MPDNCNVQVACRGSGESGRQLKPVLSTAGLVCAVTMLPDSVSMRSALLIDSKASLRLKVAAMAGSSAMSRLPEAGVIEMTSGRGARRKVSEGTLAKKSSALMLPTVSGARLYSPLKMPGAVSERFTVLVPEAVVICTVRVSR